MAGVSGAKDVLTGLVGFESLSTDVVITPSVMADLSGWLTSPAGPQPGNAHNMSTATIEMPIKALINFILFIPRYSIRQK
jgi:hypothetical protein